MRTVRRRHTNSRHNREVRRLRLAAQAVEEAEEEKGVVAFLVGVWRLRVFSTALALVALGLWYPFGC